MKMKYLLSILTLLLMNSNFGYTMDNEKNSFDSIKSEYYLNCGENNDNKKEDEENDLQLSQIISKDDLNNYINNKNKSLIYKDNHKSEMNNPENGNIQFSDIVSESELNLQNFDNLINRNAGEKNEEENCDAESIDFDEEEPNDNEALEERDPMKAGHIFTKKQDENLQFSDIVSESELNIQNFGNSIQDKTKDNNAEDDKNVPELSDIDQDNKNINELNEDLNNKIAELEKTLEPNQLNQEDYNNINNEQMSNLNIDTIIKAKNPDEKKNELEFSFIDE